MRAVSVSGTARSVRSPVGPVDVAFGHEVALRQEHPDDLDRVQRDPVGTRHDRVAGGGGQARDEAGQQLAHRLDGQAAPRWMEVKARFPAPQSGRRSSSSGRARVTIRIGDERLHSRRWSMKSRRPGSAWWRSSNTRTTACVAASRSKNVRHAPKSWSVAAPPSKPSSESRAGAIQAALGLVRDVHLEHRGDGGSGRRLVVRLLQPGPTPDHLAEGPERDALAVGRASPVVPPDGLDESVDVLEEFPGEARLADARRSHDADEAGPAFATGRVEQVPELAHLLVAPDERGLEALGPPDPAALGDDPDGSPGGNGRDLALQA